MQLQMHIVVVLSEKEKKVMETDYYKNCSSEKHTFNWVDCHWHSDSHCSEKKKFQVFTYFFSSFLQFPVVSCNTWIFK